MEKRFDTVGYKKKNICLIDVDSIIPNLALMKISSFFKKKNFKVELIKLNYTGYDHHKRPKVAIDGSKYDKIFVSILFTLNQRCVNIAGCTEVYFGGTGYNYKIKLPEKIEHIFPDYSLYPENQYSIGYLTRGCIRNCKFCFIPKKEGKLKINTSISEFLDYNLPKIMLLDNNFLALPNELCISLLNELNKTGKKITFKQGLDFRLLTKEKAEALKKLDYDGEYIFAFDRIIDKPLIEKNLKELWLPLVKDWQTKFFLLVGFDSKLSEDLERVYFLKKHKCLPYIMRHSNCYSSPNRAFYTDLASWCNQPGLFKNMPFKVFLKKRHSTKERYNETMNIIKKYKLKII